jgi:predicted acetyltransferase
MTRAVATARVSRLLARVWEFVLLPARFEYPPLRFRCCVMRKESAVSGSVPATSEVRPFSIDDPDFDRFIDICANAFTGERIFEPQNRRDYVDAVRRDMQEPGSELWAAYRDGVLVGTMRLFDFAMRIRSAEGLVGGVGMVAVDLLRKKEGIARDLIAAYLAHYRSRGATMAILHPFRPDFYRRMGFGYGTKLNQYRFRPADLPRHGARERVRALGPADADALIACYDRVHERTNGLIRKWRSDVVAALGAPGRRAVGYEEAGTLRGYLRFGFRPGHTELANELHVRELVYETPAALAGLLAFLQRQADQFTAIVFNTQEEGFHFIPADPRNGTGNILYPPSYHETNVQGLGMMYRVIDTPGIFALLRDHDFGGQTCTLRLTVRDSFFPVNDGDTTIRFASGAATVVDSAEHDIAVALDVSDFSSLLMGAVRFRSLYNYGRATIADPAHVATVDRLFAADQPPMSTTGF